MITSIISATEPGPRSQRVDMRAAPGSPPVVWRRINGFADFSATVFEMEALATAIRDGAAPETVWLLEHPPVYTAGTSAKDSELLDPRFPIHHTGRGGKFTYHGPGQRVAYAMLDLSRRRPDVRAFVGALEDWMIGALADFGVEGERRTDRVGVWVSRPDKPGGVAGALSEDKIAAIGVRLKRWVSFHGVALNVAPDLGHFEGIAPCGVRTPHLGVTSLADLGVVTDMATVDAALRRRFEAIFGPTIDG